MVVKRPRRKAIPITRQSRKILLILFCFKVLHGFDNETFSDYIYIQCNYQIFGVWRRWLYDWHRVSFYQYWSIKKIFNTRMHWHANHVDFSEIWFNLHLTICHCSDEWKYLISQCTLKLCRFKIIYNARLSVSFDTFIISYLMRYEFTLNKGICLETYFISRNIFHDEIVNCNIWFSISRQVNSLLWCYKDTAAIGSNYFYLRFEIVVNLNEWSFIPVL